MIEIHWTLLACIVSISAIFGFAVCAIIVAGTDADKHIQELKK